jgi:hypothetical protein
MKKDLPLLLILYRSTINGQKRKNSGLNSDSLLYLMNENEKTRYLLIIYKWMNSSIALPEYFKKINLYPTPSFYAGILNKTGRLKPLYFHSD